MGMMQLRREAVLAQIAAQQYGLVTLEQALAAGLSMDAVERRVRAGMLVRMCPGIYRDTAVPRTWQQRAMAASLWVGGNGAVGGPTAAALHRLDGFGPPVVITVITPRALRSRQRSLEVRRTPFWIEADRVTLAGMGVTSPERTLISVACSCSEERLEVALEDALRRRLTTTGRVLERLLQLPPNQSGRRQLLSLLEDRGTVAPAESSLEVKVIRLLRDEGFPRPMRQKVLDDDGRFVGRVDLVYPERRLILEVDSFRFHSGRGKWDRDRERRNALTALGWMVLHVTSKMLSEQRPDFLRDLARAYHRPL
jgi:very-short-patch-repair endonuclease